MRARWASLKRASEAGDEILEVTSDGVDIGESLAESLCSADTSVARDGFDELIENISAKDDGKGFVEPTPKSGSRSATKRVRLEIEDLNDEPTEEELVNDKSKPSSNFNRNTLQLDSLAVTNFKMFKQPWEKGRMNKLFGRQMEFGRSVPSLDAGGSAGWSVKLGWKEQSMDDTTIAAVEPEHTASIFHSVVKSVPEFDYFEERQWKRNNAVALWWQLINFSLTHSAIGRQVEAEATLENMDEYGQELIDATFGLKSPSTLLKRYYAMKAYADWCDKNGTKWLPIVESDVWAYMRWLRTSEAPPTRATSLVEAIRFSWYIVGFAGAGEVQGSLRLKGIASQLFIKKKPWRPAALLEVKEVIKIHQFLEDETKDLVDRVFAGHLLHLLYVRGRWSDLAAVQHGEIDEDGKFFELATQHHKGAKGQETKSRLLPLVAPCHGVTGTNWCEVYLKVREKAGLQTPGNVPLAMLLAPAKGCAMDWSSRALTSHEGTDFMRKLLGIPADGERRVSTHSLKSTAISWCAKFGLGFESRALLARHISSVANPTALYSRDLLSAVLREFCQVIQLIANSRFEPDRTRSGMLTPAGSQAPATPVGPSAASKLFRDSFESGIPLAEVLEQQLDETSPTGPWSLVGELDKPNIVHSENEVDQGQDLVESGQTEPDLTDSSESNASVGSSSEAEESEEEQVCRDPIKPSEPMIGDFFINNKSLVIHVVSRPGFFRCGRKLGWLYTKVPELHGIRCTRCFNL